METLGKFVTGLILFVIALIVRGWVVMKVWAWFIVPTFGLTPLRMIEALGLSLVVALLTANPIHKENEDDGFGLILKGFFYSVGANLFFLLMGWLYTFFM